jgi:hypothetical protein
LSTRWQSSRRRGDGQGFGLGDLGDVRRIAETVRRLRLRVFVKDGSRRFDQARILGLTPAFSRQVYAGARARFASPDPPAVALDHG